MITSSDTHCMSADIFKLGGAAFCLAPPVGGLLVNNSSVRNTVAVGNRLLGKRQNNEHEIFDRYRGRCSIDVVFMNEVIGNLVRLGP